MDTRITTVLFDCDGTLASNQVLYFRSGDVARSFSTYDGHGIALLKEYGIRVAIVTKSRAPEIDARATWLGIDCYNGVLNKKWFVENWAKRHKLSLDEICFMGNDLNDLEAMKTVGYPACPGDANGAILEYCYDNDGYISLHSGGNGAVRELAEHLIETDFNPRFVHPPFP